MEAKRFSLFEMSWPEVQQNLDKIKVAIIPAGSCEQHGPNGTFEVDTARAYEFSKRLAETTYPTSLVVPPVLFGVSPHHMKFPGTISLKPETFISVCVDVIDSLYSHGLRKFFMINGHGGNQAPLKVVMSIVRQKYPDSKIAMASPTAAAQDVAAHRIESKIIGHACEGEMSQCMYLAPWAVKRDSLAKGEPLLSPEEYKNPWGVEVGRLWHEVTANGALGDATKASYELGKELMDTALFRLTQFVEQFVTE